MAEPLVSVLIPCYNAERWVAETLASVQAQTWTSLEMILVDDGSTDASVAVALALKIPNLGFLKQANQGASAARNRAFQESKGDFIQWLDADDVLAPDKIERQVRRLQREKPGVIASGEWARFWRTPQEAAVSAWRSFIRIVIRWSSWCPPGQRGP